MSFFAFQIQNQGLRSCKARLALNDLSAALLEVADMHLTKASDHILLSLPNSFHIHPRDIRGEKTIFVRFCSVEHHLRRMDEILAWQTSDIGT